MAWPWERRSPLCPRSLPGSGTRKTKRWVRASLFSLLSARLLLGRIWGRFRLGFHRAERRRQRIDLHVHVLVSNLGVIDGDVLDVDDAVDLTDAVEELGNLVETP